MSAVEKAKKLIAKYAFAPKTLKLMEEFREDNDCEFYYDGRYTQELEELTPALLAASLQYFVKGEAKVVNDKAIPLGASKFGGEPHLPKGLIIPDGYDFGLQLNIEDFKQFDIDNYFPKKGIIYFFSAEDDEEEVKVLFYEGPVSGLQPPVITGKDNYTSKITFKPFYKFAVGEYTDTFSAKEAAKLVPADLQKQLEQIFNCKVTGDNCFYQIFGRPAYWQSEDWPGGKKKSNDRILMFQENHGEGNRHYWIKPEDLKNKKFNKVQVTCSGT